jgi:hypothetical protein
MRPIASKVQKGGFQLTLVRREGRVAMYRQHRPGSDAVHDGYEVILPRVLKTNHKGEPVEPYEAYPWPESWGKQGWTFTDLARASQKCDEFAGKVSRARHVSRRNRRTGRAGIRSRLSANPAVYAVARRNLASPKSQSPPRGRAAEDKLFLAGGCSDNLEITRYEHDN